ncbi:YitT family protein [Clostridium sp. B9]|uniref:YitT family protein n=1 Tax=Clostridium sp. B9 TaxID=3423224 RepID=UPI003D2EBF43
MNKKNKSLYQIAYRITAIILFGALAGIGVNFFLTPAHIYSSGVTGISQLLSSIGGDFFNINIDISTWVLILNLPLAFLSFKKLGKKFTLYSFLSILSLSFFIGVIPQKVVTNNQLLDAIFGGVLMGAGVGMCFRAGFSTGGTDIIVLVVQKMTGKSVGQLGFLVNGAILLVAGLVYGWELALYSLVSIYVTTKVIDLFYIQQYKLTVTIYTKKEKEIVDSLLKGRTRGVTVGRNLYGGYTNEPVSSVVTVISKHELLLLKKNVMDIDPDAFVNVQPTVEVIGKFYDNSLI